MNKGEALEKVLQMMKIVTSTNHEGERTAAESQAVKLRLIHGISDADLDRARAVDGFESKGGMAAGLFGGTFFYNDKVRAVHVAAIKAEIEAALAKIAQKDLGLQVKCLADLYDDLRGLVETGAKKESYQFRAIQWHRNEAIKKFYTQERERLLASGHHTSTGMGKQSLHEWVVMAVQRSNDLTKAQIEAIVGYHSDDWIWEEMEEKARAEAKEAGCTCQGHFTGKRTKKKINEGISRGTRYEPRRLVHMYGCALRGKV
jgi:hypothetical protein